MSGKLLIIFMLCGMIRASPVFAPNIPYRAISAEARVWGKKYHIAPRLAEIILTAADRHKIPRHIAMRLIQRESSFRVRVRGKAGELGLAQVLYSTAVSVRPGVTRAQMLTPYINIDIGLMYLKNLNRRYRGDWHKTLVAYNQGGTAVANGTHVSSYSQSVLRMSN